MRRTAQDVVQAMQSVAGNDSEAKQLVEDFINKAGFGEWPDDEVLPQSDEVFVLDDEDAVKDGVLPVFLVSAEGLGRPSDPIFWTSMVQNGEDGDLIHACFVDATPCHKDWLGLKAISEYALVIEARHIKEMVYELEPSVIPEELESPDDVLYVARDYLSAQRYAMIYRLVNHKLGGRLRDKAKAFAQDPRLPMKRMTEKLAHETIGLHQHSWPKAANKYEREVRTEISAYAARGAIVSVGTRQNLIPS